MLLLQPVQINQRDDKTRVTAMSVLGDALHVVQYGDRRRLRSMETSLRLHRQEVRLLNDFFQDA